MTTLIPNSGSRWLPVETVVQRAESEFAYVVTDPTRAMKLLADRLVAEQPNVDQHTADVRLKPLADSVEMICTDDRHSNEEFLKCIVVPEHPIEIVYHFDRHEEAAANLLERLARVLDYVPQC